MEKMIDLKTVEVVNKDREFHEANFVVPGNLTKV